MVRLHQYPELVQAKLMRRYKRFLADCILHNGKKVLAHCPNSGSMKGLAEPGAEVMLSPSAAPGRKTSHTLEMVRSGRIWVGLNTHLTNTLAVCAIERGLVLKGHTVQGTEVTSGDSRLDLLLSKAGRQTYTEVKSVTLKLGRDAAFPDSVTSRGLKHLRRLQTLHAKGNGACMLYVVQRSDCRCVRAAHEIDPAYAEGFSEAIKDGVSVKAIRLSVRPTGVYFMDEIQICKG